jgi:hypothetical protein
MTTTYNQTYYTKTGPKVRVRTRVKKVRNPYPKGCGVEDCREILRLYDSGWTRNFIKNRTRYTQWCIGRICGDHEKYRALILAADSALNLDISE